MFSVGMPPKSLKRPASVVAEAVEVADSKSSKKPCSATELAPSDADRKLKETQLGPSYKVQMMRDH